GNMRSSSGTECSGQIYNFPRNALEGYFSEAERSKTSRSRCSCRGGDEASFLLRRASCSPLFPAGRQIFLLLDGVSELDTGK
ncbi:hypothetical protein KUCAC02_035345, partial [Chaenocephalus aceratus]